MTVKDLAKAVGAPQPYLARIIMILADTGMIDARRGPGGGLRLGRDPGQITLMEIISCFDGPELFNECALGLPGCQTSEAKCPVHDQWNRIREEIRAWWQDTSLSDFSPHMVAHCMELRVPELLAMENQGRSFGESRL